MSIIRRRKPLSLEKQRARAGVLFTLPWVIGFLGLFVRPLIESLCYSFSNATIAPTGMQMAFAGLTHYIRALSQDAKFLPYLAASVGDILLNVPIILAFALLMAVILTGSFRGRTAVRTIFFLPVICGSGMILSIMSGDALSNEILSGSRTSMLFEVAGIDTILREAGLSADLINTMMGIVNSIFELTWKSGLQIILFLSGLLGISPSLYESAKIEGATAWESFWKISFPMLSPIMLLNLVYTLIDGFTTASGSAVATNVMDYIYSFAKQLNFSYSSAMAWLYFIVVAIIVTVVYTFINKRVVYTE